MKNGNKRLSLLFLINLLSFFGYSMFYNNGIKKNYEQYKTEIEKWVEKGQGLSNENKQLKEKYLEKLANLIKKKL